MDSLPAPPYPADILAKGWRFELAYEQIEQSDTWALAGSMALDGKPLARPLLLTMWYAAWKQKPAGSLPADERLLAAALGLPTALLAEYREVLMRGWWQASDGRLYHPTLVERVLEMVKRRRSDADRQALRRSKKGKTPISGADDTQESRVTSDDEADESRVTQDGHGVESRVTPTGVRPESSTGTGTDIAPSEPNGSSGAAHEDDEQARAQEIAQATTYGAVAGALRRGGIHDAAPHHPRFRALVAAGATAEEFLFFAKKAEGMSSPFGYVMGAVEGERKRAAALAGEIHQGGLPAKDAPPATLRPHLDAKATQELLREQKLTPEQIEANRARAAEIRRSRLGQGTGAQPEAEGATA